MKDHVSMAVKSTKLIEKHIQRNFIDILEVWLLMMI